QLAEEKSGEGSRFFTTGETTQGPAAFVKTLEAWTAGITTNLPDTARLVFHVLCRLEEADRVSGILQSNWIDILNRLKETLPATAALGESEHGLADALERLSAGGLLETQ